jgi:competence protein ComEA
MTHKKIRVNLANAQELREIPGIGPEQAEAIVKFRTAHGPIADAAHLAEVVGARPLAEPNWEQKVDFDPASQTAPEAPGG